MHLHPHWSPLLGSFVPPTQHNLNPRDNKLLLVLIPGIYGCLTLRLSALLHPEPRRSLLPPLHTDSRLPLSGELLFILQLRCCCCGRPASHGPAPVPKARSSLNALVVFSSLQPMSLSAALALWNMTPYLSVMDLTLSTMRAGTLTVFVMVVSPVSDTR